MTTEEKYDKALELARTYYNGGNEFLDTIFPELKESEDERIRKLLIWQVHRNIEDETNDLAQSVYDGIKGHDPDLEESIEDWKKCLAYLEKQKEQPMSAEEVLIRAGLKPYRDGNQWCVLAGGNIQEGICGFGDTIDEALYQFLMEVLKIQEEQKPLSTEETERNSIAFLEQLGYTCIPPGAEQKPAEWSEEDEKMLARIIERGQSQIQRLETGLLPEQIDWLKSLRPQPAWKPSEQEKGALRTAICVLTEEGIFPKTAGHLQAILDAFEGKESRKGWKPSEEQMHYLLAVINDPNNIGAESCYMTIKSLYNDLNKL